MKENGSIALVQDWLTGFAGGEQTLLALHQLYPQAPIFTSLYNQEKTPQFSQAKVITSFLQRSNWLRGHHQIAIPLMPLAFETFDLSEFATVISVGGGLSKGVITHPHQRHISYCHTPIRYIWRLGGDTRNEGRLDSGLRSLASHYLRLWDVASASRPDQFVANSHTVAERIAKVYGRKAEVIYPPIFTEAFLQTPRSAGEYFLSVNRLVPYKRIDLIIQAAIKAKVPLKIVGGGPERAALEKMAANKGQIEFLGRVPDADLPRLYAGARGFIQASEEDFGIVPVEAMAAGCPILAYGKGGLTESVIAGETGIFFNQQTVESLQQGIEQFPTQWDEGAIRARAKHFDVQQFKTKIQHLVEE